MRRIWIAGLVTAVAASPPAAAAQAGAARAEVRLPTVINNGMVLQRGVKAPIWGTAAPGEEITVALGQTKATAKADGLGRWRLTLDDLKPGGPFDLVVTGRTMKIRRVNVWVGDVWLSSGIAGRASAASVPPQGQVRLFAIQEALALDPAPDVQGRWVGCTEDTVGMFSAVDLAFARELGKTLQFEVRSSKFEDRREEGLRTSNSELRTPTSRSPVPIGLIHVSVRGAPAEAWISERGLQTEGDLRPLLVRRDEAAKKQAAADLLYKRDLARWRQLVLEAGVDGHTPPPAPGPRAAVTPAVPTALVNGMLRPLVPFGLRGVIWYQGEANALRPAEYRKLFPALIRDWRYHFGQGDLPFVFLQSANFRAVQTDPNEKSPYAELREAQAGALALPKTAMAVAIDLGDVGDIHPRDAQEAGRRLALAALALAYGQNVVWSGPVYDSMAVEGHTVRIKFKNSAELRGSAAGLAAKGGGLLKGFAIAGADGKYVWADAKIDSETVLVSSDQVPAPASVRYAWGDNPPSNLVNQAALPAAPFRTDAR